MTVTLGPLTPADVHPLARLHREAFPGFFLSTLGERFLVQFYRGFLSDGTAVSVVARSENGSVLGAAVGTTQPADFFRRLLRRRWLGFAAASARAVLRNPRTVPRLMRAVRYRGGAEASTDGALLSSICVDPSQRRTGVGQALMAAWAREVAARGARTAFLTTDAQGNDTVNRFYLALGWTLTESFRTREGRLMNRYTMTLNGR